MSIGDRRKAKHAENVKQRGRRKEEKPQPPRPETLLNNFETLNPKQLLEDFKRVEKLIKSEDKVK